MSVQICRYNNLKMVEKLLNLGCNTSCPGWIKFKNFESFGKPLLLAQRLNEVVKNPITESLVEILFRHHQSEWEKSSPESEILIIKVK